ncbi:H-type lectin domain-containing protein [Alcanivorax sp. 1008]|uniref:H-type lectin domain-containing protein n=1 Tax=Alcanivorax sp. 1008 TaxID=2816853 RepID=UPI001DEE76D6|nr:H-type lectin domain-containing protein [Alcanivorax sp. 1008]MCC1497644.1 hypothetical protein [Alcanivorax sp. 1008]
MKVVDVFLGQKRLCLMALALILLGPLCSVHAISLKASRVTLNSPTGASPPSFTTINFRQPFAAPPVVIAMPTKSSADPFSVRIRNVTSTSFEAAVVFPDGTTSATPSMDLHYLAVPPGTHTLGSSTLEVGTLSTSAFQSKFGGASWSSITFTSGFSQPPALLTTIQTMNNEPAADLSTASVPWMTVAARNLATTGAQLALERAEVTSGTISVAETIGYVAITNNTNTVFNDSLGNSIRLQAVSSGDVVTDGCTNTSFPVAFTGPPLLVASQNSRDGGDGGWALRCALSNSIAGTLIQEDLASDTDTTHTTELVGLLASSTAFRALPAQIGFDLEMDQSTLTPGSAGGLNWTSVNFANAFSTTPLIFALPTDEGPDPASLRLRNITSTGFDIAQVEPLNELGAHESMTVDYLAVIPGVNVLAEGRVIEAGSVAVIAEQAEPSTGITTSWDTITFQWDGFSQPPTLITAIQTINNEPALDPGAPSSPFLNVTTQNLTTTGVEVALERGEATAGSVVSSEQIGYLAIDAGITDTLTANDSLPVSFETQQRSGILGWDNGCYSGGFAGSYTSTPLAYASQTSRAGNNGGWLRRCAISNSSLGLTVDEDRFGDTERGHIAETASVLIFARPFEYDFPQANLEISYLVDGNPALDADPGQPATLSVGANNIGTISTFNVQLIAAVPEFVGLVMDAFAGQPLQFIDDAPATGMSIGTIEYSDDNQASWTYAPAATGVDTNVTHWRTTLNGSLPPGQIVTVEYQVQVAP